MGHGKHLSGRFGRPGGLWRWLTLLGLLGLFVLIGGYFYLTNSERLAGLAGRMLTDLTGAQVRIESARFNADASITLGGVRMRVPGVDGEQARLFDAEQVLVKHRLRSLARGSFQAKQITFVGGVLYRTEDAVTGKSNFALLQEGRAVGEQSIAPLKLPQMLIRNGSVRFGQVHHGQYTVLGSVQIEGRLTPRGGGTEAYDFSVRQLAQADGALSDAGPTLTGELDFGTSAFSIQAESISITGDQRMMLPLPLRRWWDRLDPEGAVTGVRFGFDPADGVGFFAQMRLDGVGLTLPFGETGWRMQEVSGRIQVQGEGIRVEGLTGSIEGIGYTVDGWIGGFDGEAPLRVAVATEPFEVGQAHHNIPALPDGVRKLFDRFAPQGTFAVNAILDRPHAGAPLNYTGNVLVSDAQLRFHRFQYPLEQVAGRVRFDEKIVEILELRGRGPSGADVLVRGQISPPNDEAAVVVTVEATDAPLDDHAYAALAPHHRATIHLFQDRDSHRRWIDTGLIQTDSDRQAALERLVALRAARAAGGQGEQIEDRIVEVERLLGRPVFELGGRLNLSAQIVRPLAGERKYQTTIRLNLAGLNFLYRHWPYPLVIQKGELLIRPGHVEVHDVVAHGLTGGVFTAHGTVALGGKGEGDRAGRGFWPDLTVKAIGVPCDDYLLASIPASRRGLVERLGASGLLDAQASIVGADDGDGVGASGVDYEVRLAIRDGELRPTGIDAVVDDVTGQVVLGRDGFEVTSMSGLVRGARLSGTSWGNWGGGRMRYGLELGLEGLRIDERLAGLLPSDHQGVKPLQSVVQRYRPQGLVDVRLSCSGGDSDGTVGGAGYQIRVRPHELSFDIQDQRVALKQMQGQAVITPGLITLDGFGGSFGTGHIKAWGDVPIDGNGRTTIRFDASAERVCPITRLVLPKVVLGVIDGLELDGRYETVGGELWVDRGQGDLGTGAERGGFGFQCRLGLQQGRALIGVPITGLQGEVQIHASRQAGSAWPRMDFRLTAERLLAADRLVSPLSVRLATGENIDELSITDLRGSCYGGILIGAGRVRLAEQGAYKMSLTLEGVALDPFVHPDKYPHDPAGNAEVHGREHSEAVGKDKPRLPTGVLAANLTIEGSPTDTDNRRGRGELEIRDASLYEVPLAMALMQVVNLTLPASKAFDRASASYLIDGDQVRFDWLSLEAPTVQMKGSGTMRYSTLELDLDMITRNPAGPVLGPVSDLFAVFKDELVSIHVAGTLDNPKPKVSSFTGIRRAWDDLFGPTPKANYVPLIGERAAPSTSGQ